METSSLCTGGCCRWRACRASLPDETRTGSPGTQTCHQTLPGVPITARLPHPDTTGSCHRCPAQPFPGVPAGSTSGCRRVRFSPVTGFPVTSRRWKGPQPSLGRQGGAAAWRGAGGLRSASVTGRGKQPPGLCGISPRIPGSPAAAVPNARTRVSPAKSVPKPSPVPPQQPGLGAAGWGPRRRARGAPALGSCWRGTGVLGRAPGLLASSLVRLPICCASKLQRLSTLAADGCLRAQLLRGVCTTPSTAGHAAPVTGASGWRRPRITPPAPESHDAGEPAVLLQHDRRRCHLSAAPVSAFAANTVRKLSRGREHQAAGRCVAAGIPMPKHLTAASPDTLPKH